MWIPWKSPSSTTFHTVSLSGFWRDAALHTCTIWGKTHSPWWIGYMGEKFHLGRAMPHLGSSWVVLPLGEGNRVEVRRRERPCSGKGTSDIKSLTLWIRREGHPKLLGIPATIYFQWIKCFAFTNSYNPLCTPKEKTLLPLLPSGREKLSNLTKTTPGRGRGQSQVGSPDPVGGSPCGAGGNECFSLLYLSPEARRGSERVGQSCQWKE